jgi:hypothetical protein
MKNQPYSPRDTPPKRLSHKATPPKKKFEIMIPQSSNPLDNNASLVTPYPPQKFVLNPTVDSVIHPQPVSQVNVHSKHPKILHVLKFTVRRRPKLWNELDPIQNGRIKNYLQHESMGRQHPLQMGALRRPFRKSHRRFFQDIRTDPSHARQREREFIL